MLRVCLAFGSPFPRLSLEGMLSNKKPLTRLVQFRDWLACGSPFPGGDAIKQKAADAAGSIQGLARLRLAFP